METKPCPISPGSRVRERGGSEGSPFTYHEIGTREEDDDSEHGFDLHLQFVAKYQGLLHGSLVLKLLGHHSQGVAIPTPDRQDQDRVESTPPLLDVPSRPGVKSLPRQFFSVGNGLTLLAARPVATHPSHPARPNEDVLVLDEEVVRGRDQRLPHLPLLRGAGDLCHVCGPLNSPSCVGRCGRRGHH